MTPVDENRSNGLSDSARRLMDDQELSTAVAQVHRYGHMTEGRQQKCRAEVFITTYDPHDGCINFVGGGKCEFISEYSQ